MGETNINICRILNSNPMIKDYEMLEIWSKICDRFK